MSSEIAKKQRKDKIDMNKKITIPRPFSFVEKKRENKTIMQSKLEKDLEAKEKELKMYESWQFRANPVPADCLIPMLNTLDATRDKRLQTFKDYSATINKMKVFSFVERDEESKTKQTERLQQKWQHEQVLFKAKLVPTQVSLPLYEDMVAERK